MNKITKIFGIAGICTAAYACQPRSAPEPIIAENFHKGDSIVNTDFGTDAKIIIVRKLDGIKYDTIVSQNMPFQYSLKGAYNVDLTSGVDDATGDPIVRTVNNFEGTVTLTSNYNKKK